MIQTRAYKFKYLEGPVGDFSKRGRLSTWRRVQQACPTQRGWLWIHPFWWLLWGNVCCYKIFQYFRGIWKYGCLSEVFWLLTLAISGLDCQAHNGTHSVFTVHDWSIQIVKKKRFGWGLLSNDSEKQNLIQRLFSCIVWYHSEVAKVTELYPHFLKNPQSSRKSKPQQT